MIDSKAMEALANKLETRILIGNGHYIDKAERDFIVSALRQHSGPTREEVAEQIQMHVGVTMLREGFELFGVKTAADYRTMSARQAKLFDLPPRASRGQLMHVFDCQSDHCEGLPIVDMRCAKCGHESGWLSGMTVTESKRGLPCPKCAK